MKKMDRMSFFASFGLAAVLLVLTIYSICAAFITLEGMNQAKESAHMSNLYQQAHYSVSDEDSLLHQYYLDPTPGAWAEYSASVNQLNQLFQIIQRDGDSNDHAYIKQISGEQEQFQQLTQQLSKAVRANQIARAKTIHDVAIDIIFDRLEVQANNAANAEHIQNLQCMNKLIQTQQTIIISTSIVFAMSLLLLGLFARMMHSYQIKLNEVSAEQAAELNAGESKLTSSQTKDEIVQVLSSVAALRDEGTFTHAQRMVELAEATTRQLGRSEEEITLIRLAAQMHDIGKIGIPDAILHKPGSLNQEEWGVMRRHPEIGQQLLVQAGRQFELISHIVVAHHERYDGSGYPYGLAEEQIPLGARILAVIDSYDAMTSTRSYREALPGEYAKEELQRCAGSQYDPEVVQAFLQILERQELQKSNMLTATF